jgi:hypothetical protein
VLRNQTDQAITNTAGASLSDVIAPQKSRLKNSAPHAGGSARIEVIRGISKTSVSTI